MPTRVEGEEEEGCDRRGYKVGMKEGRIGRNKMEAPDRVGKNSPLTTMTRHFGRQHFLLFGQNFEAGNSNGITKTGKGGLQVKCCFVLQFSKMDQPLLN